MIETEAWVVLTVSTTLTAVVVVVAVAVVVETTAVVVGTAAVVVETTATLGSVSTESTTVALTWLLRRIPASDGVDVDIVVVVVVVERLSVGVSSWIRLLLLFDDVDRGWSFVEPASVRIVEFVGERHHVLGRHALGVFTDRLLQIHRELTNANLLYNVVEGDVVVILLQLCKILRRGTSIHLDGLEDRGNFLTFRFTVTFTQVRRESFPVFVCRRSEEIFVDRRILVDRKFRLYEREFFSRQRNAGTNVRRLDSLDPFVYRILVERRKLRLPARHLKTR